MIAGSLYRSAAGEREVMDLYDAVLSRWPVSYDMLTVPTGYGDTFIIACGKASAPPLILLHGLCSNAVSWISDIAEYSRYFRTYAVDILGEPGRSAPNRPSWNSPAYAEWMEDLLNALKIEKVHLLGISYGGWLSLKFAAYLPERIRKLVLLTPAGVIPVKRSFIFGYMLLSLIGTRWSRAINRITLRKQSVSPDDIKFVDAIMTHFKSRYDAMALFTDEELRRLTMPILLQGGKQDALFDLEKIAARMKNLVPDLTVTIHPDKGHVLVNQAKDILPFLLTDRPQ